MTATHNEPSIEELEEDLRRAVQLWGDDCSTANALRQIIRERKKLKPPAVAASPERPRKGGGCES